MSVPILPLGDPGSGRALTWMHFYGERRTSRRLLIRGALLAIPTLGFYRFWLITQLRRYLWQNTRIGDDAFEYVGTARELLLGFLAAVAILVPVYLAYFLVGLESERWKAFASLPLVLFFLFLAKFAEFRARRYRLTRTVFRGIRFTMAGSGVRYALTWALWSLLVAVTLGLARPWQVASLERYKVGNTRWGNLACRFEGTGWQLFKQGIWAWLVGFASIAGMVVIVAVLFYQASQGGAPSDPFRGMSGWAAFIVLLYPLVGLCWLYYVGIEWRWWINGLRMEGLSLSTTLKRTAWINVNVKFYGLMLVAGACLPIVVFIIGRVIGFDFSSVPPALTYGILVVAYLAAILAAGVAYRQILLCGFWRIVVNSIRVEDIQVLDAAMAAGAPSGILGEGLAEALDVGAF